MKNYSLISIIVPCYNEEDNISNFWNGISSIIPKEESIKLEIIFIDDGSTDLTIKKIIAFSRNAIPYTILEFSRNFGKEAAMTAGIDAAIGDAAIIMDVDLQDDLSLIPKMIKAWQNGAEVVLAQRIDRQSDHILKRWTAFLFYRCHNMLSSIKIPENVGDFRLIDRCVINAVKQLPERQRFMKGLFAYVGFKTETLTYVRKTRLAGKSKFSPISLWNLAMEGLTSFTTIPLKIWTYLGGLGAILSILYAFYIVIRTIFWGREIHGYASIFFAVVFFGSIQMITAGILGEYIGRVYMESKNRPLYIIRKKYD